MADFSSASLGQGGGDILSGIGAGLGAFSQSASFGANADIDRLSAQMAHEKTRLDLVRQQREAYQLTGEQKAIIGSSGITESGSALDVMRQSARDASLDRSLTQYKGGIEELNWQVKYKADREAADNAGITGALDIAGGVLKGAAAVALL